MNRLPLFLFLIGSLFIFIGINNRGPGSVKSAVSTPVRQASSSATPSSAPSARATPQDAIVTRVIDGDTIDVRISGKEEKVRLIGINAPETNECFGKEATEKASSILSSKSVSLEVDPTQDDRDKYHRLLRYVFINGSNFDELMVREGFAKEYTYHTIYEYQSQFKEAERKAKENNLGLWSHCQNKN